MQNHVYVKSRSYKCIYRNYFVWQLQMSRLEKQTNLVVPDPIACCMKYIYLNKYNEQYACETKIFLPKLLAQSEKICYIIKSLY